MAVDTHKGMTQESPLRTALHRAGDAAVRGVDRLRDLTRGEEVLNMTMEDALLDRKPIRRIEAKQAMLQYVNAQFRQRTNSDGVILAVSLEQLVQDLTNLVMELDERAGEPVKKPEPVMGNPTIQP